MRTAVCVAARDAVVVVEREPRVPRADILDTPRHLVAVRRLDLEGDRTAGDGGPIDGGKGRSVGGSCDTNDRHPRRMYRCPTNGEASVRDGRSPCVPMGDLAS